MTRLFLKIKRFRKFFIEFGLKLASDVTNKSINTGDTHFKNIDSSVPFCFVQISIESVLNTLGHLKVSKSTGPDEFPAKMLRIAADVMAPSLIYIFNLSLSTGMFVDDWRNARVCAIYKDGSKHVIGNYRPISVQPIVSKVFKQEMFQQLCRHLNKNNLISKFQSSLHPGHSTPTALIQMRDTQFTNKGRGMGQGHADWSGTSRYS